jgi:hypothetical protein
MATGRDNSSNWDLTFLQDPPPMKIEVVAFCIVVVTQHTTTCVVCKSLT